MMGKLDTNPIPVHAVTCWADDHNVYVAMPMTSGGIPYITRFALNEGGLSAALSILRKRQKEILTPSATAPANYTLPPKQPQVKLSKAQEKLRSETTESQREAARLLIAKMGLK
jgi:hypothetical protein